MLTSERKGQEGNLLRESYIAQCERRIRLVLVDHLDDVTLADLDAIDASLVEAMRYGKFTRQQFDDVRVVGIIARGFDHSGDLLAVIEASLSISQQDVHNAHRRAGIVRELTGRTTVAFCVTHYRWPEDLADIAAALDVRLIHYELPGIDIP